ncbi:Ricin B-related lectin [Niveomyces insectorum RCEF 264]|uniref:Ricin B-related lectin n=1 Tax=Niveomyces insectorum RCEF 264 TaxID=1081102 RepID=A0A162MLA1_9HYPO|nr:Ricin B-related lectin [Niveomyces insectorum RCEF 264]
MFFTPLVLLALAAVGLADVPAGYKTVYITSNVNAKFVVVPKAAKSGSTVVVQTLANTAAQQWYIKAGGTSKIQLAGTTLCLDAGAKTNWKDMANIYVNDCDDSADGQKWDVKADGRIGVAASSPEECIDLQYMRATNNNPVGLYSCAGLGGAGAGDKGINWPLADATS